MQFDLLKEVLGCTEPTDHKDILLVSAHCKWHSVTGIGYLE